MALQKSFILGLLTLFIIFTWDQQHLSWINLNPTSVNALYYNNRNECNSVKVSIDFMFSRNKYRLNQTIYLRPTRTVSECFFYMDMDFQLHKAQVTVKSSRLPVMLEFMPDFFVARIMNGSWMENVTYKFHVEAVRELHKAHQGVVFRTFRHLETRLKSWYAIIKMPGMNCGSVIICLNNYVDLVDYELSVTYPKTHRLFCLGKVSEDFIPVRHDRVRRQCLSDKKRNPNDFQFAVGQFLSVNRRTQGGRIEFISASGEGGKLPEEMLTFWDVCQRMSVHLQRHLRSVEFRPYNLSIYMLPNFDIERPVLKGGYCYFTPSMIKPGSTAVYVDLLHCFLRQGFMDDRKFESWNMIWGFEGIVELFVGNFSMPPYLQKREDYADCLDGGATEMANLADLTTNIQDAQVYRPVRKSAGFWKMLERMNLDYAKQTYVEVYQDVSSTQNLDSFLKTITKRVELLNMTEDWFKEMLYSWTAAKGFPVLEAKVDPIKRQVCVITYNWGQEDYIGRYVLPFKLSAKYPFYPDSETVWTHLTRRTCISYQTELYPYLINRDMSVIARILYDEENLLTWVDVLANKQTNNILTYDQKLNLVNDIFFFATENKLDYMIALHYVQLLRAEVDERLWSLFDKMVAGLDAKARYTPIYNAFMQYIGDLMSKLYEESIETRSESMVAIKWSCFMNMLACKESTQGVVMKALLNHEEIKLPFDYLCAGIRKIEWEFFVMIMNSLGQPDWKEPHFYVQILACVEDRKVLRTLLLHMFYLDSWRLSPSLLTDILLTMVRMGKPGSDVVFWYLDHDPLDMLKHLRMKNFLAVVDELANYMSYTEWLDRLTKRMHLKKILDADNERVMVQIKVKIRENKRWINRSYMQFQEHVYTQYSKYVLRSDG